MSKEKSDRLELINGGLIDEFIGHQLMTFRLYKIKKSIYV